MTKFGEINCLHVGNNTDNDGNFNSAKAQPLFFKNFIVVIFVSIFFTTYSQEYFHDYYWTIFIKYKFKKVVQNSKYGTDFGGFFRDKVIYSAKNMRCKNCVSVNKEYLVEDDFPKYKDPIYKDTIVEYFTNSGRYLYYDKKGELFKQIFHFSQPHGRTSVDTIYYKYDLNGNCIRQIHNNENTNFYDFAGVRYHYIKNIVSNYSFNNKKQITNVQKTYYNENDSILIFTQSSYSYNELGLPTSICEELKKTFQSEWELNFEHSYAYFPRYRKRLPSTP